MDDESDGEPLLKPGANCWRIERADRVGLLVGGRAYFRAVRRAFLQAERHAVVLAWDLHSEVLLERDEEEPRDGLPRKLGPFLNALLEERPGLEIHLLVWDFSMIYAAEREWRLFSEAFRDPHPRLHLHYDDRLPMNASHHQKVIVIDDALAFAGGFDLSTWRWDSAEHRLHDERRIDPKGHAYQPYHDLQLAITGPAAKALGDLCAERWQRATGRDLPRRDTPVETAPWIPGLAPFLESADVGIARTYAAYEPWPEVREIERLHLDLIATARDYLYFENQYFSSRRLTEALAERLREPDGPEVIIVLTREAGWLEEGTMGLLRNRLFEQLTKADQHRRLRLCFPRVANDAGDDSSQVYVHAKIVIADDRYFKIGSSNLSNRSMRVDSEVDLVIERPESDPAIRERLIELLAIHFGTSPDRVADRFASGDSPATVIDSLMTETGHSLRPYPHGCDSSVERQLADTQLLDPDEPLDPGHWIRDFVPADERPSALRRLTQISLIVAAGLLLTFLIKEGWGGILDKETVIAHLEAVQSSAWAPLILVGLFLIAGMSGVPLNLLLVASTIVLGPLMAISCGYVGAHLSAIVVFGLGHRLGKPLLKKWNTDKVESLNRQLSNRGIFSVALVRLVPVAPFPMINLVAGASLLRFRTFNLGTLLGMAPGMTGVVLLTHQLNEAVTDPGWGNSIAFITAFLIVGGVIYSIRRALRSRASKSAK